MDDRRPLQVSQLTGRMRYMTGVSCSGEFGLDSQKVTTYTCTYYVPPLCLGLQQYTCVVLYM